MDQKEMSRKGGMAKSDAKTKAARKNASKPRGKWVTSIAYEYTSQASASRFGSCLLRGKPPQGQNDFDWAIEYIEDLPINKGHKVCDMLELEIKSLRI